MEKLYPVKRHFESIGSDLGHDRFDPLPERR